VISGEEELYTSAVRFQMLTMMAPVTENEILALGNVFASAV
jgi:hypothetical protein